MYLSRALPLLVGVFLAVGLAACGSPRPRDPAAQPPVQRTPEQVVVNPCQEFADAGDGIQREGRVYFIGQSEGYFPDTRDSRESASSHAREKIATYYAEQIQRSTTGGTSATRTGGTNRVEGVTTREVSNRVDSVVRAVRLERYCDLISEGVGYRSYVRASVPQSVAQQALFRSADEERSR